MNNGYWRYVYWYESDIVWLSIRHLSTQIKVLQRYVTILNIKYFVWFLLGFTTNVCSKLGNYKIEQTISVAFLTVLLHDRLDICVKWQTLHCCYSREHWESPVSIEAFVVNCYCFFPPVIYYHVSNYLRQSWLEMKFAILFWFLSHIAPQVFRYYTFMALTCLVWAFLMEVFPEKHFGRMKLSKVLFALSGTGSIPLMSSRGVTSSVVRVTVLI